MSSHTGFDDQEIPWAFAYAIVQFETCNIAWLAALLRDWPKILAVVVTKWEGRRRRRRVAQSVMNLLLGLPLSILFNLVVFLHPLIPAQSRSTRQICIHPARCVSSVLSLDFNVNHCYLYALSLHEKKKKHSQTCRTPQWQFSWT